MNMANKMTLLRIVFIPVFLVFAVLAFALHDKTYWWGAAFVYVMAGVTDILDGQFARASGQVTSFGKLMDPIADKLTVTAALLVANMLGLLSHWVTLVVIFREFIVTGIRLIASSQDGTVVSASLLGKFKTVLQFCGLTGIFIAATGAEKAWFLTDLFPWLTPISFGQWVMYASTVIALWSGVEYVVRNWHFVRLCAQGSKTHDC